MINNTAGLATRQFMQFAHKKQSVYVHTKQTTNGVLKDFLKKMSGSPTDSKLEQLWALCCLLPRKTVSEVTSNTGQIRYKACIWTLEKQRKGKLRKLHNVQIQNLYCSPDTKTFATSRRVRQKRMCYKE